jgi:hypothetical protein
MKTKDIIAGLLLFFFVSVPCGKALYWFSDSLKLDRPIGTILCRAVVVLVLLIAGIFLFRYFILSIKDLRQYEAEEREIVNAQLRRKMEKL